MRRMFSEKQIKELADERVETLVEGAESGTIQDVLGLDSDGGLVKGTISGGTKLYQHKFSLTFSESSVDLPINFEVITTDGTKLEENNDWNNITIVASNSLGTYQGNDKAISNVYFTASGPKVLHFILLQQCGSMGVGAKSIYSPTITDSVTEL